VGSLKQIADRAIRNANGSFLMLPSFMVASVMIGQIENGLTLLEGPGPSGLVTNTLQTRTAKLDSGSEDLSAFSRPGPAGGRRVRVAASVIPDQFAALTSKYADRLALAGIQHNDDQKGLDSAPRTDYVIVILGFVARAFDRSNAIHGCTSNAISRQKAPMHKP
jgi:hypothetical protein